MRAIARDTRERVASAMIADPDVQLVLVDNLDAVRGVVDRLAAALDRLDVAGGAR